MPEEAQGYCLSKAYALKGKRVTLRGDACSSVATPVVKRLAVAYCFVRQEHRYTHNGESMFRTRYFSLVACIFLALIFVSSIAQALPYSNLVDFGDSWADSGDTPTRGHCERSEAIS